MSEVKTDLVILGAGPSGLAAAIYTTREDIETIAIEKGVIGGLAATTDWVDNYPGYPEGVEGFKLADGFQKQAERFGTKIEFAEVTGISKKGKHIEVKTTDNTFISKAALIAIGSDYKKLGVKGEEEYYARGVHYCATCDGAFYRDKKLAVVGGGNSGVQEAIFLTRFATHIDLLVRSEIKASDVLQKDLQKYIDKGQITVHLKTTVEEIEGKDNSVTKIHINRDGKNETLEEDGIFVFVGLLPNTQFLRGTIDLDEIGLIKTDDNLMTNMEGVFASGDVRSGATLQIASAAGEGATAALRIREYIEKNFKD